jgi:hypothetical protein
MKLLHCVIALLLCPITASVAEDSGPPAAAIQDNSFLVEEAYNQEAGVVQHIFTAQYEHNFQSGSDDRAWLLAFTQEWPVFSQRHQFSYTIPYGVLDQAGSTANGIGDVFLNYRFQALFESDTVPAFAPRFSLVLPTGDVAKGLGDDTLGYQFNLPFSKIVHDRWTLHANAGLTYLPDLRDRTSVSYRLGGSAIYAVSRDFNLMLELVGDWFETVDENRRKDYEFLAVASPGFRYAFNWPSSQLVLGLAAPIGLNGNTPEIGAFVYASFEHVFLKERD